MQINLSTIANNSICFRSNKQITTPEQKKLTNKVKPFLYLGASVVPITMGILGVKSGLKGLKLAINKVAAELPKIDSLLPEEKTTLQKIIKEGLDPKLAEIFVKVKNIEDRAEFATEVYNSLFELLGYKAKPAFHILPKAPSDSTTGGWINTSFSMQIYKDTTLKGSKAEIFDTIAHELEHFKQSAIILRTKTLGADALIEATAKRFLKLDKENASLCLKRYGKPPAQITITDINNYYNLDADRENLKQFAEKLINEKGIIEIDSEEGLLAKKYLVANQNYTNIDPTATEETQHIQRLMYGDNLLEEKAFAEGHKHKKLYTNFILKLAEIRLFHKN